MTPNTLQKGVVGLAATCLLAVVVLLTSALTPVPRAVLAQGTSLQEPCKEKKNVDGPELPRPHRDPLKVLLRGILL